MTARSGFSLAELVVSLAVAGILATLLFGALIAQVRLARATADRALDSDALRTASHVLAGEARRMSEADVRAVGADSLAIRAFRGAAIVCVVHGERAHVRYRGDRLPDPRKDSLLVILADGQERSVALPDVRPDAVDGCVAQPGEQVQQWTTAEPVTGAAVLLVFESGSFHLVNRALRYRLGSEGRQPLTAEVLAAGSHFEAFGDDRRLRVTLVLAAGRRLRFALPLAARNP